MASLEVFEHRWSERWSVSLALCFTRCRSAEAHGREVYNLQVVRRMECLSEERVFFPCSVVFPLVSPGQAVSSTSGESSRLPVSLMPLPISSSSSSSSSWLRTVVAFAPSHSPSQGKVPSSSVGDGRVMPNSSTHQQWPRCMPLEDRH